MGEIRPLLLARAELSPAEEAAHIARRKVIWDEMNSGQTLASIHLGRGRPQQFAAEVASVVGARRNPESVKRDVNLKIARARELGPDIKRIVGTSLDKGVDRTDAQRAVRVAARYLTRPFASRHALPPYSFVPGVHIIPTFRPPHFVQRSFGTRSSYIAP